MKKLGILFVLMVAASFAFAQQAVVTQTNATGSAVEATVDQTGVNVATVTQQSVLNVNNMNDVSATVDQTNTPGGVANTVTVTQTVTDVDDPHGSTLKTAATQNGEENTITQTQMNDGNRSSDDFVSRDFKATQTGDRNAITQSSEDGDQGSVEFEATQIGNDNSATQLTNRAGGSSYDGENTPIAVGKIMQDGNFNEATQTMQSLDAQGDIYQEGDENDATQTFGNNTKENHGDIDQIGSWNIASQTFTSGDNTSISELTATQNGDGNYSEQTVTVGNNNIGTVTQTGPLANPLMGNEAYQMFTGNLNVADVTQSGSNNWAKQDVSGSENDIDIKQTQIGAIGNEATQTVTGDMNGQGLTWHNALIWQIGSENEGIQNLNGYKNDVVIQQTWNSENNFAKQDMSATSSNNHSNIWQNSNSVDNNAYQLVEGSFNYSHIEQNDGSSSSSANQYIYGASSTMNTLNIFQTGDLQTATQTVTGSENIVSAEQNGSNNIATQLITGSLNTSSLYQNAATGAYANLTQDGNSNTTLLTQDEGSGSRAIVLQQGNNNILQGLTGGDPALNNLGSTLTVDQLGDWNTANVSQTAAGTNAAILQNGNGNIATVNQN
jgi:hypothetical protein